jgi:glutamate--cysteine ligase catalytic subunit
LSGACPIWRGYLSDIDCRWNVLSQAADDRTAKERQRSSLSSRYCPAPSYLCEINNRFNDVELDVEKNVVSTLNNHGHFFWIEGERKS